MDTSDILSTFPEDHNPNTGNINRFVILSDVRIKMVETQDALFKTQTAIIIKNTSSNEERDKFIKDIERLNKEKKTYEIKQFGIETRDQRAYDSVYRNSYMNHNGGLGIIKDREG